MIEGEEDLSTTSKSQLQFSIYPNPSNGILNISIPTVEKFSYRIYDLNGRLLQQNNNSTQKISVENLASGLYLLQVSSKGKVATKKLVIN